MKQIKIYVTLIVLLSFATTAYSQTAEPIDLGLSVEWAATNLNSTTPEDFGGYYGWADPTGLEKSTDVFDKSLNWISNLYGGPQPPSEISGTGFDIVHVRFGDGWRLPTLEELKELTACQHQWTKHNGVNGYEFTGKNGNKIFLPAGGARNGETVRYAGAVGYYWTGTLGSDQSLHRQRAHRLYIGAEGLNHNPAIRYSGFSIRPVRDKNHTGSVETITNGLRKESCIYDLTGRRLSSKPEKGFYIQNGVVVIPGSGDSDHQKENISIFDFELTPEEMDCINALERREKHDWY